MSKVNTTTTLYSCVYFLHGAINVNNVSEYAEGRISLYKQFIKIVNDRCVLAAKSKRSCQLMFIREASQSATGIRGYGVVVVVVVLGEV